MNYEEHIKSAKANLIMDMQEAIQRAQASQMDLYDIVGIVKVMIDTLAAREIKAMEEEVERYLDSHKDN